MNLPPSFNYLNRIPSLPVLVLAFFALIGASNAQLVVQSTISMGSGKTIYGMTYALSSGVNTLYVADNAGSAFIRYNLDTASQTLSLLAGSGNYALAASVGNGDFTPEYYLLGRSGGITLRYNPTDSAFAPVFYSLNNAQDQLNPIIAITSANPYGSYQEFWAIQADKTTLIRLGYTGPQTVLQSITSTATDLTGITVDPTTNRVFAIGGSSIYAYSTAGALLSTYELPDSIVGAQGLAYNSATGDFFVSDGSATIYVLNSVPEPATLTFLFCGVLVICAAKYRGRERALV